MRKIVFIGVILFFVSLLSPILWAQSKDIDVKNDAGIIQTGNSDSGIQTQVGNNNVAQLTQTGGNSNTASQIQTGNGFSSIVVQTGNFNNAAVVQHF